MSIVRVVSLTSAPLRMILYANPEAEGLRSLGAFLKGQFAVTTPLLAGTRARILVVGIVGGVGSGKSTLARWVAEHHPVAVIDADRIGHEVLQQPAVIARLRTIFGDQIVNAQGQIQRSALAARVFGDDPAQRAAKQQLEAVVHPEIQREVERRIAAFDPDEVKCVLLDAAVLLESNWRTHCDAVIFVDTPLERRQAWVEANRGWSAEELKRREASQWSLAEKRAAANAVVVNDGTVDESGTRLWSALARLI